MFINKPPILSLSPNITDKTPNVMTNKKPVMIKTICNLSGLMPLTLSVILGKEPIRKPAKIQIRTNIKCSNAKENK